MCVVCVSSFRFDALLHQRLRFHLRPSSSFLSPRFIRTDTVDIYTGIWRPDLGTFCCVSLTGRAECEQKLTPVGKLIFIRLRVSLSYRGSSRREWFWLEGMCNELPWAYHEAPPVSSSLVVHYTFNNLSIRVLIYSYGWRTLRRSVRFLRVADFDGNHYPLWPVSSPSLLFFIVVLVPNKWTFAVQRMEVCYSS